MGHIAKAEKVIIRSTAALLAVAAAILVQPALAPAAKFEGLSLERLSKLGEADRYQLTIAQDYFEKGSWLIAASEYEKFLSLYESSIGAPYAQLQWSLCQANLRKQNTAIKDGYQTVIDYYPESPEAITAAYYIGSTYKGMGEIAQAKKAYLKVIATHPTQTVAVRSKIDLADLARIEKDTKRMVTLWNEVAFATERNKENKSYCTSAAESLASYCFHEGDFDGGVKALATSYSETELWRRIDTSVESAVPKLIGDKEKEPLGYKLADKSVAYFRSEAPANPTDDAAKNKLRAALLYVAEIERLAKRVVEAEKVYDEILKTCGTTDRNLEEKASFYKRIGRRDQARETYGRLEDQIRGLSLVAGSYREPPQENRPQLAVPIYEELIGRDTANASKWQSNLASCYYSLGKYKEAIAAYRQSADQNATNQIAHCYRALKDYKEALALFQQVAVSNPNDAQPMLEIARTYEQAAQDENAIKSYQLVCKRYPKSQQASEAHVRLNDRYKINITLGGTTTE